MAFCPSSVRQASEDEIVALLSRSRGHRTANDVSMALTGEPTGHSRAKKRQHADSSLCLLALMVSGGSENVAWRACSAVRKRTIHPVTPQLCIAVRSARATWSIVCHSQDHTASCASKGSTDQPQSSLSPSVTTVLQARSNTVCSAGYRSPLRR